MGMDGSVSCYGGPPIVLRLLVFFSCLAGPPGALALTLRPCMPGALDSRYWLFGGLAIGGRHGAEIDGHEV